MRVAREEARLSERRACGLLRDAPRELAVPAERSRTMRSCERGCGKLAAERPRFGYRGCGQCCGGSKNGTARGGGW